MDFDADHAVSSASPECCMWWCRQDACPHERSGSGGRSTSSQALLSWTWRFRGTEEKTCTFSEIRRRFPLCEVTFKNANCRKCCRSWGLFYCSQEDAADMWGKPQTEVHGEWRIFALEERKHTGLISGPVRRSQTGYVVSALQPRALTSVIWVTWGNGLMAVSWVCFNTLWVGGLMQQGRDGTLMYVASNGCFCRTTNTFLNTSPGKSQIRPCCIFTQWF